MTNVDCCDETAINEGESSRPNQLREQVIDSSPVWVNALVQDRPRATYGLDLCFRGHPVDSMADRTNENLE